LEKNKEEAIRLLGEPEFDSHFSDNISRLGYHVRDTINYLPSSRDYWLNVFYNLETGIVDFVETND